MMDFDLFLVYVMGIPVDDFTRTEQKIINQGFMRGEFNPDMLAHLVGECPSRGPVFGYALTPDERKKIGKQALGADRVGRPFDLQRSCPRAGVGAVWKLAQRPRQSHKRG